MKIYPDTKIYMLCPANFHSGGPELCHQLVSQLLQFGVDAYIFYVPSNVEFNEDNPVDDFYKKYHVPYVLEIEDAPRNILIINESSNWIYYAFKSIRKIFWWMSVDNYIKNLAKMFLEKLENTLDKPMQKFFYFDKDDTEHWVQSEYARQFLKLNGIPNKQIYTVEDYLNQAFLSNAEKIDISAKKDIVAFNPVKGMEVTKKLISIGKDIKWIPIKNMTPEQVQALLARAKIYIDFGNHPGKDRIPRESALSGCVVITGKRGAAANDIDINIPAEFKFDETEEELPRIIEKIQDVFENFEENYKKQEDYRAKILDDKNRFAKEVAEAFGIKSTATEFFAITQGLSEKGVVFIDMLYSNNLIPDFIVDDTFYNAQELPDNELIKTVKNTKYFFPPNLPNYGIMIISSDDAKFLYAEGRINKFALLNPDDEEFNFVSEKFNARQEDILIVNA